jgi:hypothetical protein
MEGVINFKRGRKSISWQKPSLGHNQTGIAWKIVPVWRENNKTCKFYKFSGKLTSVLIFINLCKYKRDNIYMGHAN